MNEFPVSTDDLQGAKSFLDIAKATLSIMKQGKDLLPEGSDKAEAEKGIDLAEQQLQIANAQIAQNLGYPLCHCAFPPIIMLRKSDESYQCSCCDHAVYKNRRTGNFSS